MRNPMKLILALCLLLLGLTAQAADYGLTTGDLVRITVYDQPDLTTETRVTEHGSILFPLIGEVPVAGVSANEASSRIAKALEKGGFIKNPQVNLVIMEFRGQEVSVLGYVNRPGRFPLQKASKLTDVLAMAGGATNIAADTVVVISDNKGKSTQREIDLLALFKDGGQALNVDVANNDILYIPREPRFYIYGEVQRPGSFRLERNMTVVQALSVGGGLTLRGTQKGMQILRRGTDGQLQTLAANLADTLMPDDVIYVKESLF